jgi:hypothetical protein
VEARGRSAGGVAHERPPVLYFQSGPQIPTGQVSPPARIRALAEVLDRHETVVIEDTTVAPVAFGGTVPMLADECRRATVVSTGSLSKTCWAGMRLGWIRGPEPVVAETIYRHLATDLGPSVPSQVLALELMPHLEAIAATRRSRLEAVVDAALEQLGAVLTDAAVTRPDGGSILWGRFPVEDSLPLVTAARRHGVRVAPGSIHTVGRLRGPYVRIDVDRPPSLVREGIRRLPTPGETGGDDGRIVRLGPSRSSMGWKTWHERSGGEGGMRYALLVCVDQAEELSEDEVERRYREFMAFQDEMEGRGVVVSSERLRPPSLATSVRVRDEGLVVADGPFAETKEQIAGFYIVDCEDLDEAIEIAATNPGARYGTVEVRPVWEI